MRSNLLKKTSSASDLRWTSIGSVSPLGNRSNEEILQKQLSERKEISVTPTRMRRNDPSFFPQLNTPTHKLTRNASTSSIRDKHLPENINSTPEVLKPHMPTRNRSTGSPAHSSVLTKRIQTRSIERISMTDRVSKTSRIMNQSPSKVNFSQYAALLPGSKSARNDDSSRKISLTERKLMEPEEFLASYQSLNPQFFEELKALPNNKLIHYTTGYYYGQLFNQSHNGKGVLISVNGKIYEGEWVKGEKSGAGTERFADGHVFSGQFVAGKPHGEGSFKWKDGDTYEGGFVKGLKHGKGVWKNADGVSYSGDWIEGKGEGFGTHIRENGDKYEGEFKNSLKHGKGTEIYSNGDKYIGEYKEGKPCGYGEYYWRTGALYKGNFHNGLMEGKGSYRNGQGDRYEGDYKEGKKHGYGEFTWVSGNVYKGNFNNDLREGYGEMHWIDGSCYKGEWVKGIQHGQGELKSTDQRSLNGQFNNNVFMEENQIIKVDPLPKLAKSHAPNPKPNIRMKKQYSGNLSHKGLSELTFSVSKAMSFIKKK